MLITTNQAASILRNAGLTRDRSRWLLATGVAGPGIRTTGALLYDEARVRALDDWRFLTEEQVATACPHGLLVGRLARGRAIDVSDDPAAQRHAAGGPWPTKPGWWMVLWSRCRAGVPVPFVATVSGYVLLGADVIGIESLEGDNIRLELAEPGPWYDALRGRRWIGGRGGPALLMWGWRPISPTPAGEPP